MARLARVVAVGLPHHITQRGNGRRDIFLTDALRQTYLDLLKREAEYHRLRILAYCLMTNHLHLVAVPETERSMSGALRHTHGRFAQHWNTVQRSVGHMWQNRYYSCALQPARVWPVIRYVELNPVRAAIVQEAAAYPWSSANAHATGHDPSELLDMNWWRREWPRGNWINALDAGFDHSHADAIRRATYTGRPFGDNNFIAGLESRLGRKLAPRIGGRPRKQTASLDIPMVFGMESGA